MFPLSPLRLTGLMMTVAFAFLFNCGIALAALLALARLTLILPLLFRVSLVILLMRSARLFVGTRFLAALSHSPGDRGLVSTRSTIPVTIMIQI